MTGLAAAVSTARDHITGLRDWADDVVTTYDVYVTEHRHCFSFANVRSDVVAARDDLRDFATLVEQRLDASGWVTTLGDRSSRWNQAASHASDAEAAVSEQSLRAVASWSGGASPRYRDAIPLQRAAIGDVDQACLDMKQACLSVEASGVTHFEAIATLLEPLASLSATFGPGTNYGLTPPITNSEGETVCSSFALHVTAANITAWYGTPHDTAVTALETADENLRTAVTNAFSAPSPGPYAGTYGRATIAQQLGTWPTVGA